MKTQFAVAGSMRSGTQSIHYYLSQHPSLHMCPIEKQGFFANDLLFKLGYPQLTSYENQFSAKDEELIRGEVCPDYLFNANCLSRLQIYNPDIKLIAILRNPAERAYSHWQFAKNMGTEHRSFPEAIQDELRLIKNDDNQKGHSYLSRGFYGMQVQNMLQYFDPHQILILKAEDLMDDASVVLYQIFQFLDVPYYEVDQVPQNLGDYNSSMDVKDYNSLLPVFKKDIYLLEELLGWNCNDWLRPLNEYRPLMSLIDA